MRRVGTGTRRGKYYQSYHTEVAHAVIREFTIYDDAMVDNSAKISHSKVDMVDYAKLHFWK